MEPKKTDSVYSASIVKNISNFQKVFFFPRRVIIKRYKLRLVPVCTLATTCDQQETPFTV